MHVNARDMDTTSSVNCKYIPKVHRLTLYSSSHHELKPAANMPSPLIPVPAQPNTHMTDASSAAAQAFRASPPPPKAYSFYN